MEESKFDVIVFGASSFVGQILCRYLTTVDEEPALRWAIAGRSQSKLDRLKVTLGRDDLDIILADADDEEALRFLCRQTRVVISTVGPYALYGDTLVKVCVETGTDYCDLTGEPQWIRRMLDQYGNAAEASGARIVNCCGFDSIPSDLGAYYTQQHSFHRLGEYCDTISMRVYGASGGFSGGTIASMLNLFKETSDNPELRKALANPYLLCDESQATRQVNLKGPAHDALSGRWMGPFVMAAINTRIVHRSNALLGYRYGKAFCYDEAMLTGKGLKGRMAAAALTAGLASILIGGSFRPGRWFMQRFLLPSPGEGPSPKQQEEGFFKLRFYGSTPSGKTITTQVEGDRDPGYGSTSKMLGQAAICLARDFQKGPSGGFWTPASLMGETLLTRLEQQAGLTFSILD